MWMYCSQINYHCQHFCKTPSSILPRIL